MSYWYERIGTGESRYPISYTVHSDGEQLGIVYKDWYETGRTRDYDWCTQPPTERWATRQDAADALKALVRA